MSTLQITSCSIRSDLYSVSSSDSQYTSAEYGSESPWILSVLASLLERLVVRNERLFFSSGKEFKEGIKMCAFSATQVPAMSIHRYLQRMFKYAHCSPSVFVVSYAYIDRLIEMNPGFLITSLNVHRLLITSVMVATKFLDDLHYRNSYYAKVGGLTTPELNDLEIEFVFKLRFRLHVTVSVFESYCSHLEREVAMGGGYQIERSLNVYIMCSSRTEEDVKSSYGQDNCKKQRLRRLSMSSYAGC
eukprot:Gb_27223 [translate_table: standard]